MKYAVRELEDEIDLKIIYLFYPNLSKVINDYCESNAWFGMIHAFEFETSLTISIKPDLVQMDKAVRISRKTNVIWHVYNIIGGY